MTNLTPNHPAVEAAVLKYLNTRRGNGVHDAIAAALTAALPDLTAATEENLARLRDTPAGRALRAEGWRAALAQLDALAQSYDDKGDHLMAGDLRFVHGRIARHNPYRQADA